MFEVIYMKADYEPWWMFEGWEETIQSRELFDNVTEAAECLQSLLERLRHSHDHEIMKKECFYAFWSDREKIFCEGCDEDLQLYHGVLLMNEGKPIAI